MAEPSMDERVEPARRLWAGRLDLTCGQRPRRIDLPGPVTDPVRMREALTDFAADDERNG